jgi:hypothetical protein
MKQPILDGVLESPLDLNGYGFVNIGGLLGTFEVPLTFSAPFVRSINTISIPVATASVDGYLAHGDWMTFNSKQAALGFTPAPVASPVFTGIPLAPTASADTNTGQIATTAFVVNALATAVTGLLSFKGLTDCSGNPNYPSASKGDTYIVSVAGKIGGASGTVVDVGDLYIAEANNAGGTEAAVGASWAHLEHSLAGALLASNNLSDLTNVVTARTNLGLGTLALQNGTFSGTSSGTNTGDQTLPTIAATSTILKGDGAGNAVSTGFTMPSSFTAFGLVYAASTVALSSTSTNATTTRKFLAQSGNGTTPTAPTWQALTANDIPDLSAVYEPFSPNLGSWAAITRAAGFDTFTATPTVANFKSLLSNETTVVGNLLSLANPSVISFIKIAADNTVSTRTPSQLLGDIAAEPALGNPGTSGFVLSSTTGGVRSWVAQTSGVTNSAGNNIIPKSNGTNLVASGIDDDGNSIHLNPGGSNLANIVLSNALAYARLVYDTTYVSVENGRINFVAADPPSGQGFRFNTYNVKFGTGGTVLYDGGDLGTPSSGTLTNCTFPTLNQSTTGSAATLTTPRAIYGNNFDGSAALTQIIASTYGGTGNGFTKFSGPTTSEKTFTLPNSSQTLLYSGGALGTPSSGNASNLTSLNIAAANVTGRIGSANLPLGAQLYDNAGTPKLAADLNARQLIASNGTTVMLAWDSEAPGNPGIALEILGGSLVGGVTVNLSDVTYFGGGVQALGFFDDNNSGFASTDGNTYFNNSGFHGVGAVIAGTKTATGTATTTFTVTIGVTMANTTYKVTTEGDNALSAAVHYVNNKTTTTFDIVYLAGLTGAVSIDWIVSP